MYSKCKLSKSELSTLQGMLDDFSYTCGASLSDLGLARRLEEVVIRDLQCHDPLEKLYYSLRITSRYVLTVVQRVISAHLKGVTRSVKNVVLNQRSRREFDGRNVFVLSYYFFTCGWCLCVCTDTVNVSVMFVFYNPLWWLSLCQLCTSAWGNARVSMQSWHPACGCTVQCCGEPIMV